MDAWLDEQELSVNAQWIETMRQVAGSGIPEPTYPWDISNTVGLMLSAMQVDSSKQAFSSLFETRIEIATEDIATIMSRSSYVPNPKSGSCRRKMP